MKNQPTNIDIEIEINEGSIGLTIGEDKLLLVSDREVRRAIHSWIPKLVGETPASALIAQKLIEGAIKAGIFPCTPLNQTYRSITDARVEKLEAAGLLKDHAKGAYEEFLAPIQSETTQLEDRIKEVHPEAKVELWKDPNGRKYTSPVFKANKTTTVDLGEVTFHELFHASELEDYIIRLSGVDFLLPEQSGEGFCFGTTKSEPIRQALTSHKVNGCNDEIEITVMDEPGCGGANHFYLVEGADYSKNPSWKGRKVKSTAVLFQNGTVPENGTNGLTHEVLLAILIHRMEGFQNGNFACIENQVALDHLKAAQETLKLRTKLRVKRGVEGSHKI